MHVPLTGSVSRPYTLPLQESQMTLHIDIELCAAVYDLLRLTPPYRSWKLPPASEIKFVITNAIVYRGQHSRLLSGVHKIEVSQRNVGTLFELTRVMGHEMIHVHEEHSRACRVDVAHSWRFNSWADSVCRWHSWDRKAF